MQRMGQFRKRTRSTKSGLLNVIAEIEAKATEVMKGKLAVQDDLGRATNLERPSWYWRSRSPKRRREAKAT